MTQLKRFSKHTPLPWKVEAQNGYIGWLDSPSAGLIYIPIRSPWREDAWDNNGIALANSQLIVTSVNARPKMEELVKATLEWEEAMSVNTISVENSQRIHRASQQMLTKAREVKAAWRVRRTK